LTKIDLSDGLVIIQMIDKIAPPGTVEWHRVTRKVTNKYHKLENCNYAVSLGLSRTLNFSLVNVSGSDIVEGSHLYNSIKKNTLITNYLITGNLKLILSLIWQARFYQIQSMLKNINSQAGFLSKEMTEKFILNWANSKVSTVNSNGKIESFKDVSLKNRFDSFLLLFFVLF